MDEILITTKLCFHPIWICNEKGISADHLTYWYREKIANILHISKLIFFVYFPRGLINNEPMNVIQ